ncbi:MAG: phosphate-starvation-inducible PsiE family protein [Bacteroidales bacterium]|nr:phosphate-starvation-inducible PsiE family protein [Bacteroidales bacterium]
MARYIERLIIYSLIVMMSGVLILATVELGYYLIRNIVESDYLLLDLQKLMDLFGVFLLVLIGIELLDTIKVYLRRNVVHVEVVVLVGIIAIARKVVVMKIEELSGSTIIGLGILVVSLAIAYYLIKRVGHMRCAPDEEESDEEKDVPEQK